MSQQSDVMPLDLLLLVMRREWAEGNVDAAIRVAQIAAPYLHPRPSGGVRSAAPSELRHLTDAQLLARMAELDRGVEATPGDPPQPD